VRASRVAISTEAQPRLVAVVGPTATGKSLLATEIAERLGGEIVNADSMQLYRGMDIGTAKPTPAERATRPHHLYDVLDVTEAATVAAYRRDADAVIGDVIARGGTPVLVGGSGLYVRAVVDGLTFPGTSPDVRAALETELDRSGAEHLHRRLAAADPAAAAAILPTNGRRIVRALEVIELTGRPFTATLPDYRYVRDTVQVGISRSLDELDERIARRTQEMFDAGFVDEVRALERQGLRNGRTASRALGYAQVLAMFDGAYDEANAQVEVTRATRRFARRQRSWFGRDPRITWLTDRDLVGQAIGVVSRSMKR
jgi:tRNA dimethylallyltransferase